MKKIFIILFVLSSECIFAQQFDSVIADKFKIVEIDRKIFPYFDNVYSVNIESCDSLKNRYFSVIIVKDTINDNYLKDIKVGNIYYAQIKLYFDCYMVLSMPMRIQIANRKILIPEENLFGQIALSDISEWKLIEDHEQR